MNNKRLRPIPAGFANYDGLALASDFTRDGLGYPAAMILIPSKKNRG